MRTTADNEPSKVDVEIIGAGIVGVCCALALRERGLSVHLIDRDAPGEGASFGNAGVISPWSFIPMSLPGLWKQVPGWLIDPKGPLKVQWSDSALLAPWAARFFREGADPRVRRNADAMARLVHPCITQYRDWLQSAGADKFIRDSSLVSLISGPPPPPSAPAWQLRAERGASFRIIDANELHDIEPAVSPHYSGAVLLSGQARALAPGELCKALADEAQQAGTLFTRAGVQGLSLDTNDRPVIHLPDRRITANRLILAAGPWSSELIKPLCLPVQLPMVGERGYHLEFTQPSVKLNNSILDPALHFIVSSMNRGVRAAGTSELARLDRAPNFQRARVLADLTGQMLPELNTRDTSEWMGIRASFPDSLPAIGPLPGAQRIIAAFGQSHWGMSMAPGTGLLVAAMVTHDTPFTDVTAFRPNRF